MTYRGVAIAKGVAQEWARISRHPKYFKGVVGTTIKEEHYAQVTQPILWLSFTDDKIATIRAVDFMKAHYVNAEVTHKRMNPALVGLPRIGHSGFFNPKKGKELWNIPLDFLGNEN